MNTIDLEHLKVVFKRDKERLVTEWLQHGKAVIAVDYDDTIYHWRHTSSTRCIEILKLLVWAKQVGCFIMIHTASDPERYQEIKDYCKSNGLEVDSINENPIPLPYGNGGKPYYEF